MYSDDEIKNQIKKLNEEWATINSPEREKIRILYVDDEPANLRSFKSVLRREYTIFLAESADEGRKIVETENLHIIVTDQIMPKMTGIEFLESIKEEYPDPMRILLTGYSDINAVINAINKGGVYRYMNKPWNEDEMRQIIESSYEVFYLREKTKKLTADLVKTNRQLEFLFRQKLLDV
ncbi:MAG: response regulator [Schleiferiaceae bacterium]|jgi:response regulator RpfG family c-di-GMP phosphodiesterase|nr:response regulator [Schleiferiaceae bacterium]